jgi:polyhydroxyalkanoate synthase
MHLAAAAATWLGSPFRPPSSSDFWPDSRPELRAAMAAIEQAVGAGEQAGFAAALDREARRRLERLKAGISAYHDHPYRRAMPEPPELWRDGSTRLLDYRTGAADPALPALLVVPSLVNRSYILDLSARRSLMRDLARRGFRPLLVDWDAPGDSERGFGLDDYVAGRLERALDVVIDRVGGPVIVVGYCMGGLLALALASRRRRDLAGLACLATPWDFHAERPAQAKLLGQAIAHLEPMLQALGELPVDAIQALFAALDPLQVPRKFMAFAAMDRRSAKARQFVLLEDWVNDGVPLPARVARECLAGWYGENLPARGRWKIRGRAIRPESVDLPALVVVPDQDRIVPPATAEALGKALPNARVLRPAAGHIGMIVGGGARRQLWDPLAQWAQDIGANAAAGRSGLSRRRPRRNVISHVRNRAPAGASGKKGVKR